jgi:hypothetical protein
VAMDRASTPRVACAARRIAVRATTRRAATACARRPRAVAVATSIAVNRAPPAVTISAPRARPSSRRAIAARRSSA